MQDADLGMLAGPDDMARALRAGIAERASGPLVRLRDVTILVVAAAGLAGCGTINDKMSSAMGSMPGIGMPAGVPERPETPHAFPAVHDMPQQRTTVLLTAGEQRRIESELLADRQRQQDLANPPRPQAAAARKKPAPAAAAEPATRPRAIPASSASSIY